MLLGQAPEESGLVGEQLVDLPLEGPIVDGLRVYDSFLPVLNGYKRAQIYTGKRSWRLPHIYYSFI